MDKNSNNHLAPIIYIAESPEQAINYKWDSRSKGLNDNIRVLNPEDIYLLGKGNENFYLPYDLTPGEVLVRHPYNQGYIQAADAEEEYLQASAEGMFLIARCLGATKIIYKKSNIAEYKREIDSNNCITYKVVDINLDFKNFTEEKFCNKINMTREFSKQEFTQEQFEKAKSIAKERGFFMSSKIRSLIEARDPEICPPLLRQETEVEISSSLNKVLDIAFSLNTVPFFKLDSNTKIATQKKIVLSVKWEILF